jgi:CoA:oxalate CoA-transferase
MPGPLEGVKVLSFGQALAGPFSGMILSDLGAEVIKIEQPGRGDHSRLAEPVVDGMSAYFLSINRGKKSVTIDLKTERGREIIISMVRKVDILLENFRPGVMTRLQLDYETIRGHNPRIIYASLSGFGQTGPYSHRPAFDMIAQGMGGVVGITGHPGGAPARVGYSIGDMGASLFLTIAILAALHEREKSGEGQWIDVAMLDCQVALCENACARYLTTGEIPRPLGSRHPLFTPFQVFPTRDGHIVLIAYREGAWENFCQAVGKEAWISDERFNTNRARLDHYDQFEGEMNALMQTRTTEDWLKLFDAHGVMCGSVNDIEQVVRDPQVTARDMIVPVKHSRVGTRRVAGTPMKFSRTPCQIERGSPELGEHTSEVLINYLGLSKKEIEELKKRKVI